MTGFETVLDWQSIVAVTATGVSILAAVLSARALGLQREIASALNARIEALSRNLAALCGTASQAGDRLVSVERRSREIQARQEQPAPGGPVAGHYRQAVALLERGASTQEIVEVCGMARGEAELVAYMYGAEINKNKFFN